MKKITGLFLMATFAFAGVMGINYFISEKFSEKVAFSKLKTKLQKTLVLMEQASEKPVQKTTKTVPVAAVTTKPVAVKVIASFSQRKKSVLNSMNKAFNSLVKVRHIFRHEIAEMIDIIKDSKPSQANSSKMKYAKNWNQYIQKSITKFNMNERSRGLVKNMASDMGSYIKDLKTLKAKPTTSKASTVRTITPVKKAPMAIDISAYNQIDDVQNRLMKKSVVESLAAMKNFEVVKGSSNDLNKGLTYAWLLACALFALTGLWMSRSSKRKEDEVVAAIVGHDETLVDSTVPATEETFLFDDIVNNLSTLCQAKGVRLNTDSVNDVEEEVEKFQLAQLETEIESFVKTVIRSLGRDSEKEIKIHLKDADKKVKIIAAVSGDNSFDINMKSIASGFRDLEEKLAARKGVFNIDQSILGDDINFVMQISGDQVESEDEYVNESTIKEEPTLTV